MLLSRASAMQDERHVLGKVFGREHRELAVGLVSFGRFLVTERDIYILPSTSEEAQRDKHEREIE